MRKCWCTAMREMRTLSEAVDCIQPPPRMVGLLPGIGEKHGEEVVEEGAGRILRKAGESPRRLAAQSKTYLFKLSACWGTDPLVYKSVQCKKGPVELGLNTRPR